MLTDDVGVVDPIFFLKRELIFSRVEEIEVIYLLFRLIVIKFYEFNYVQISIQITN